MPFLAMGKKNLKELKQEHRIHVLFIVLSKARLPEKFFVLFHSTLKLVKLKADLSQVYQQNENFVIPVNVHFIKDLQTDQHHTLKRSYKRCFRVNQKVIDKYEKTLESKRQSISFCSVALLIKSLLILSEFNKQIQISAHV